ncbi:MAG: phage tail tape measure protein, partial [Candidatus Eisenbacteria sp.]|nr:phage tail tape measure protein [Candidatus Eisenbacteria bacterium]
MIGKKIFSLLGTIAINSKSAIAEIKAVEATGGRMATKLSSAWTKMGKVMKVAAVVAVAAAGAAVVGFAKSAISEFVKIEEAAGQVFTLLPGLSEEAKDEMLADVMDVSREFGFLPDKVLPALYQALSAGVPKENVFEYMRVASEMAVGGAVELEVAVLSLAQVMNAYGADVSEVRDYSDQFFSIVADGITTIEELSGHLFKIAPVAADVGVKFRDVAGWLAELTAQGTPTAEAATYIRGALNELSKAGMQAFVAFEKAAGQTFPDFIKAGGSVADAVKILEDYANETGVSVKDLFGSIEGGAAVLGITGEKFDSFAQKVENAGSAAGKTADAFVEMAATLRKKLDRLAAWWATLKWKIGAKLEEPFEKLLTFLEDNQEAFEDFVTNVFEKIVDALKWILENGDTVKVIFQGIGAAIATIATAKIISLIASLNALGLTIVAIAGAGLLGPYLADIYDAISEGISSVADETTKLKHVTDAVAGVFIEIIQGVEAAVKQSVWNIYQEGKASAAQIEAVALALAKAGEEATAALREGVRYDEALESFGAMVDEILTQYGLIDEVSTETYQGIVDAAVQAWKEVEDSGDALALTAGRVLQTWEELSDGVEEGAERQGVAMQMHIDALDATRAALAEWRAEQQAAGEDVEVLEEDISELQQELIDLEEALAGTEKGSYKYVMALKDLEAYHEKVSAAAEYLEDRNIEVNATLGLLIDATSQYG